jgi:hypothetical protein
MMMLTPRRERRPFLRLARLPKLRHLNRSNSGLQRAAACLAGLRELARLRGLTALAPISHAHAPGCAAWAPLTQQQSSTAHQPAGAGDLWRTLVMGGWWTVRRTLREQR